MTMLSKAADVLRNHSDLSESALHHFLIAYVGLCSTGKHLCLSVSVSLSLPLTEDRLVEYSLFLDGDIEVCI